ncbi:MAG: hypothetical protein AB9917_01750 [Negativicutes bacterium]
MNRAVVIFVVCLFVAVLSAETNSTFAGAPAWHSRLTPDKAVSAAAYQWVVNDRGKNCFIDLASLKFLDDAKGRQIADVWVKCELDDVARRQLIDARYGQEESAEGLDRLAYIRQHIWFNLFDPAYRNPASLPLRMIAQETYYDVFGTVIHSTIPLTTWEGGKWVTLPGCEEIVQKVLNIKSNQ